MSNIMKTWEVVIDDFWSDSEVVTHVCARKEMAEYLRDWCEALNEDSYRSVSSSHEDFKSRYQYNSLTFRVQEGEVIL